MKPSRGRVSLAPFGGEGWGGLSQQHVVTKSVRDSALLLDVACTPQLGDPYWAPPPTRRFLEEATCDPGKLRIAFSTAALTSGKELEPPVAAAVKDTAKLLESLGHHVEELQTIPGDFRAMAGAVTTGVQGSVASSLLHAQAQRGRPVTLDDVETLTMSMFEQGQKNSAVAYYDAIQTIHAVGRQISSVFETCDVVMLATLGQLPVPLGWMDTNAADLSGYGDKLYSFMPNTQQFNVTGSPSVSVPLSWSDDGLPIGIMFSARNGDEATLFRLAAQLEKARPWAHKRPVEAALLNRA
jgi:Asp-tRNA(Asn)/Glu-tRNA(Gln) amidotransferase A subunit family amidase